MYSKFVIIFDVMSLCHAVKLNHFSISLEAFKFSVLTPFRSRIWLTIQQRNRLPNLKSNPSQSDVHGYNNGSTAADDIRNKPTKNIIISLTMQVMKFISVNLSLRFCNNNICRCIIIYAFFLFYLFSIMKYLKPVGVLNLRRFYCGTNQTNCWKTV